MYTVQSLRPPLFGFICRSRGKNQDAGNC